MKQDLQYCLSYLFSYNYPDYFSDGLSEWIYMKENKIFGLFGYRHEIPVYYKYLDFVYYFHQRIVYEKRL